MCGIVEEERGRGGGRGRRKGEPEAQESGQRINVVVGLSSQ